MIPDERIKKLITFTVPQIKELRYLESPFDIVQFCFEVMDDCERYRKDEEFVELFYDTLDHMNIKVPNSPREKKLDLKLFARIWDCNHSKSASFPKIASQLGINKDTLKKNLVILDPEHAGKLKNRKRLTALEQYEILAIMGFFKVSLLNKDEAEKFGDSILIRKRVMYALLNTDKKTLESDLTKDTLQKLNGLNWIPLALYIEVKYQINGTLPAASEDRKS